MLTLLVSNLQCYLLKLDHGTGQLPSQRCVLDYYYLDAYYALCTSYVGH
jgi:hypothetical protein